MLLNQHFCFLVYPPQADSSTRKIPSSGNFPWRVKDGPDDENGSKDRNQVAGCSQPISGTGSRDLPIQLLFLKMRGEG